jgi:hypothetical protein
MNEHTIQITSAEIANLWVNFMNDSAAIPVLKHFLQKVKDAEIKPLIEMALNISRKHVVEIASILEIEQYPVPIGFTDEDVNVNAPRLFSDTFSLYFLRNLGRAGIASYGIAFSMGARKDIRDLYSQYVDEAKKLEDEVKEIMLSKGIYIRPPQIPPNESVGFVEKQSFLKGWFGERRTLTAMEIAHIYMNLYTNSLGKVMVLGFSQVTESEEIRAYFVRGVDLAKKVHETLESFLKESSLPVPMTWDSEVTNSTVSPFSDQLMMFLVGGMSTIGMANFGGSIAFSMRRDIVAKYLTLLQDAGLFSEDGINLMIKNKWFERPPQSPNREYLAKEKNK